MSKHKQAPSTYKDVAILAVGSYTSVDGRRITFTGEGLAALAENFDAGYYKPPLNLDHESSGPSLGSVAKLNWDGEYLRADLENVPASLATLIDAGRYPFRSAEVYPDLAGRGPSLRALALLGSKPPAVKGLPPMPPPEKVAVEARQPIHPVNHQHANPLQPTRVNKARPLAMTIYPEVAMPQQKDKPNAEKAVQLAEENIKLADENRTLRLAEKQRETSLFMAELRRQGKLTPALESAGVEALLLSAEEQPALIQLAEGQAKPSAEVLRDVLNALPPSFGFGEADFGGEATPAIDLSAEEKEIASQLGLSEKEYSEIKDQ